MRAISDALRLELRQWNIHVSLIEVAPVKTAIFGKSFAALDGLESTLGREGFALYEQQIAAIRKAVEKAAADADPPLVIAKAILHALTSDKPKTRYLAGHGGKQTAVAAALPDRARDRALAHELGLPEAGVARRERSSRKETSVSTETKPKVLIVYFTPHQAVRVGSPRRWRRRSTARGCDVTKALIEFTDERYVPKLSQFPMKHPIPQIAGILPAQLRHKTGEIRIPPEAQAGDYDLVLIASPTWWFQTSMPIRSYLESPAGAGGAERQAVRVRVDLAPLLQHQPRAAEEARPRRTAGGSIDKTHFVVAGGQVKSMLSWLGYMKHGEPQKRVFGLKMPPPNLKPDFEEQARSFVDGVVDQVLDQPVADSTNSPAVVESSAT